MAWMPSCCSRRLSRRPVDRTGPRGGGGRAGDRPGGGGQSCASRGAARRLIESGGLYLNNRRIADLAAVVTPADVISGRLLVLRSGKKNFHLVRVA